MYIYIDTYKYNIYIYILQLFQGEMAKLFEMAEILFAITKSAITQECYNIFFSLMGDACNS